MSLPKPDRRLWKFTLCVCLLVFALLPHNEVAGVIRAAMADAYIQVTSFVALTLIIFYFLEKRLRINTAQLLKKRVKWQVPIAAFMGALPGCGGAIIVMTQYVLGRITFGSMVAVLTTTMGDAAFLLLAREPKTALLVMLISSIAGIISGYVVDGIHGRQFMHKRIDDWHHFRTKCGTLIEYHPWLLLSWYGLLSIGVVLGISTAFQLDTDRFFGPLSYLEPTTWIGFVGAFYCLWLWAMLPDKGMSIINLAAHPACRTHVKNRNRIVFEAAFVTTWVIFAFLIFELGIHYSKFDLEGLFKTAAIYVPIIAVLVGFIPGCGPQIIVTTMYLGGIVPFSAQIGNAISNDGDALFPALALAPKTAILATLYTSVPALIISYSWYFLLEAG